MGPGCVLTPRLGPEALKCVPVGGRFTVRIERLDNQLRRPRVDMRLKAPADRIFAAPKHHCIEKPLIAAAFEFAFAKADTEPIIDIIRHGEIARHVLCRDAAGYARPR